MTRKPSALDQGLARLHALRDDPGQAGARSELMHALGGAQSALIAAAAQIVADAELSGFEDALRSAFERLLSERPAKRDPGCRGKAAIARALYHLDARAAPLFLRGVRHVQREPVWGGSVDTAIELRGTCALGLVRAGYADAMIELAELLADPEPQARAAAAHAIAYSERADVGVPLLRYKALAGDADPEVMSACFSALLALAKDSSLPFVLGFAARGAELGRAALLALGESKLPAAFVPLCEIAERAGFEERTVALLAIALLRAEPAWDYLLGLVREGEVGRARGALEALATYREDRALSARVIAAAAERGERELLAYARKVLRLDA